MVNAIMSFFTNLTSADYVDISCALILLLCILVGISRGISGELAWFISLAASLAVGFWIYVPGATTLGNLEFMKKNPQFTSLIAFCIAALAGLILFLALIFLLKNILKISLDPIWDKLLGLLAGAFNGIMVLAIVFTLAMILPQESQRELFCKQSRAGKIIIPKLMIIFKSEMLQENETKPKKNSKQTSISNQPVENSLTMYVHS